MKLIVGLGNPGEKYEGTRHNLGFMVLDHFLKDYAPVKATAWKTDTSCKSKTAQIIWQPKKGAEEKLLLVQPQTFMNESGIAVKLISMYYKIEPSDIWVIHDELDLPLRKIKIRFGGAAAGHHGVESIMHELATDAFWRIRLGIGKPRKEASAIDDDEREMVKKRRVSETNSFVLGDFAGKDASDAKHMVKDAVTVLQTALEKGLEAAMNQFNTK